MFQPQTIQSVNVWKTLTLLLQSQQVQGQCRPAGHLTVIFISISFFCLVPFVLSCISLCMYYLVICLPLSSYCSILKL